jgi:dihydropteridine reductase
VASIDLTKNDQADLNVLVDRDADWVGQESSVVDQVGSALNGEKLDAVICVAGGWAGGNASADLAKNSDLMWKQSVWSSVISSSLSAKHLKEGGMLAMTGAHPALKGTPGMIGYGMAKAAVHHLTKSLAGSNSGLPANSLVVSILPITLDTPMNRKWMADADFSTWTPLQFVAE